MSELLFILLINMLVIIGFNRATEFDFKQYKRGDKMTTSRTRIEEGSKMIFWFIRFYSLKYLGKFWSKPICTCPTCMASVHSTYVYAFFLFMVHFQIEWIVFYPIYILALAGLSSIVNSLVP